MRNLQVIVLVSCLLTGTALCAQTPDPPGNGLAERLRQLDRNGDGKLTADEVGRPGLFRRLDKDGDGVVTLDEARKTLGATGRPPGAPGD